MPVGLKGAKFVCLRAEAVIDISEIGDNYSRLKHTKRICDLDVVPRWRSHSWSARPIWFPGRSSSSWVLKPLGGIRCGLSFGSGCAPQCYILDVFEVPATCKIDCGSTLGGCQAQEVLYHTNTDHKRDGLGPTDGKGGREEDKEVKE